MAETNILALRLGPGKHLHGRKILDGAVEGDQVDFFHDMIVGQELTRPAARGFQVISCMTGPNQGKADTIAGWQHGWNGYLTHGSSGVAWRRRVEEESN
jgi:hypothetical protein